MDRVIQFGIAPEYIPDWGIPEAIREIYQNFKDYGEFNTRKFKYEDRADIVIKLSNDYVPDDLSILSIGKSIKSEGSIGKYGEGLKLAMMIFLREERKCSLRIGDTTITPIWYDDEFLGQTFALNVSTCKYTGDVPFAIKFECTNEEWDTFNHSVIVESDVVYTNTYGSIVDKPAGDIYVGGIFVTNLPKFNYAYDFKPLYMELERDRTIPRQFDVEYYASHILQSYKDVTKDDLFSRDTNYITTIPSKLQKQIDVTLEKGKVECKLDGKVVPYKVHDLVMKDPKVQKHVARLKYHVTRKRKPHSFINDFMTKYKHALSSDMIIDLQVILTKSKEWE